MKGSFQIAAHPGHDFVSFILLGILVLQDDSLVLGRHVLTPIFHHQLVKDGTAQGGGCRNNSCEVM